MSDGDASTDLFQPDGRVRMELFEISAAGMLRAALESAQLTRWDSLRSPHLFMGLLSKPDPAVRRWAAKAGLNIHRLLSDFEELFREPAGHGEHTLALHREFISDNLIRVLREAVERADENEHPRITSIDLLICLLTTESSIVAECLSQAGLSAEDLARWAVEVEK